MARVAELEARLAQNSTNSSKPPSSDGPSKPTRNQAPTGRKPGGQPGHKGHSRGFVPPENVDEHKLIVPTTCTTCQSTLVNRRQGRPPAVREQQVDIPPIKPHVLEVTYHWRWCPSCERWERGPRPEGVPAGAFGPQLLVLVALLTGKYRQSKRLVADLLSDVLNLQMSPASVCRAEQTMSTALAPAVEEAREHVRNSDQAHVDETGWRERLVRAWMWVALSGRVVVFTIARSRGSDVARQILGADFVGFLITDRWSGYTWADRVLRQLCWAHLKRDFQSLVDRGGHVAAYGVELLKQHKKMFHWWTRVKAGLMPREEFIRRMRPIQGTIERLLDEASACPGGAKAREILKLRDALFTFVEVEGIEPTNNAAERALRPAVVYRKTSFGTFSESGSRYIERIMSVVQTCKAQARNIHAFLSATLSAHLRQEPGPSLIPGQAQVLQLAA